MKKLLLTVVAAAALTGCATSQEYVAYSEAQKAYAAAEAARFKALADIAKQGDTTAKVAATMALQQAGGGGQQHTQIAAPKSNAEIALQWTGLLLPNLTQFYSINRNSAVAIQQSNNATQLGIHQSTKAAEQTASTNQAFVGLATGGFTAASAIANSGFQAAGTLAGKIQAPQPNVTVTAGAGSSINAANTGTSASTNNYQPLRGTGVIGSGSYSFSDTRNQSTTTNTSDSRDQSTTTTTPITTNTSTSTSTTTVNPPPPPLPPPPPPPAPAPTPAPAPAPAPSCEPGVFVIGGSC